jgi:cell division protein FtsI/penicillin-binding protein 2
VIGVSRDFSSTPLSNALLVRVSSGQSAMFATPLQMARAMATLGSGRDLPFASDRGRAELRWETHRDLRPRLKETLPITPAILAEMKKAMTDAVNRSENAVNAAAIDSIAVAGVTGITRQALIPKGNNTY